MKRILLIFPFVLLSLSICRCKTLHVPSEYPTIQAAINAAENLDTVLVDEGTYFENIRYWGKKIVVTSRYYLTKNWGTVRNTIIDGSKSLNKDTSSTVQFLNNEDSLSVLDGFTITGGKGTLWAFGANRPQEGGGIILAYSSAIIRNNIVTGNKTMNSAGVIAGGGGGISSLYGNPTIYNNVVYSNASGYAGGIVLNWSKGIVKNNIIFHNKINGQWGGGGMMIWQAPENAGIVENNTIVGNISSTVGGGITISAPNSSTIPVLGNNIVWGNRQATGGQIDLSQYSSYSIVEDYNSGTNISVFPQLQEGSFQNEIGSSCIDAGNPNSVYNDIEDPLYPGMALLPSKATIRNDAGAFGGSFAKILPSLDVSDIYVSKDTLNIFSPIGQQAVRGIELLNLSSKSIVIDSISHSNNLQFSLNKDFRNLALGLLKSDSIMITFKPQSRSIFKDTIKIFHKVNNLNNPIVIIVTGTSNSSPYLAHALSAQTAFVGQLYTYQVPDSTFKDNDDNDTLIYKAMLANGSALPSWLSFNPDTRTFSGIPLSEEMYFIKVEVTDLMGEKASTSFFLSIEKVTGLNESDRVVPDEYYLFQNYPNPFNPSTVIKFNTPHEALVSIKIYDILGNEVDELLNKVLEAGFHQVRWTPEKNISSGIYFVNCISGNFVATKKIILQK